MCSCSWEGGSLRIALAVDSFIYFANIRPDYKVSEMVAVNTTMLCCLAQRNSEQNLYKFNKILSIAV